MDINNYSYTGDRFADKGTNYALIEDYAGRGYITLDLEQWGCDHTRLLWVISGYWEGVDVEKTISADNSKGWETLRHSYETAARTFNDFVTDAESIPLF